MQLRGHARSKDRSPGLEYVASLATLAVVAGVLVSAGMVAGYVQAEAPPVPYGSTEYRVPSTEYPGLLDTRYSILSTQARLAVPFPHPTPTFTATSTETPPGCGLLSP